MPLTLKISSHSKLFLSIFSNISNSISIYHHQSFPFSNHDHSPLHLSITYATTPVPVPGITPAYSRLLPLHQCCSSGVDACVYTATVPLQSTSKPRGPIFDSVLQRVNIFVVAPTREAILDACVTGPLYSGMAVDSNCLQTD